MWSKVIERIVFKATSVKNILTIISVYYLHDLLVKGIIDIQTGLIFWGGLLATYGIVNQYQKKNGGTNA